MKFYIFFLILPVLVYSALDCQFDNQIYVPSLGKCICTIGSVLRDPLISSLNQDSPCIGEKSLLSKQDSWIEIPKFKLTQVFTVKFWFVYSYMNSNLDNYFFSLNDNFFIFIDITNNEIILKYSYSSVSGTEQATLQFPVLSQFLDSSQWVSVVFFHDYPKNFEIKINNDETKFISHQIPQTNGIYINGGLLNSLKLNKNIGIIKNFEIYKGLVQNNKFTLDYFLHARMLNKNCLLSIPLNESEGENIYASIPNHRVEMDANYPWTWIDVPTVNIFNRVAYYISDYDLVTQKPIISPINFNSAKLHVSNPYGYKLKPSEYVKNIQKENFDNIIFGFYYKLNTSQISSSFNILELDDIFSLAYSQTNHVYFLNKFTHSSTTQTNLPQSIKFKLDEWNFFLLFINFYSSYTCRISIFSNENLEYVDSQTKIINDHSTFANLSEFLTKSQITLFNSKENFNNKIYSEIFKGNLSKIFFSLNGDIPSNHFNISKFGFYNSPYIYRSLIYYFPLNGVNTNYIYEEVSGRFDLSANGVLIESVFANPLVICDKTSKFGKLTGICSGFNHNGDECFSFDWRGDCNQCFGSYFFDFLNKECVENLQCPFYFIMKDDRCFNRCGDSYLYGQEECDDWNTDDNDGCSSRCKIEDGFNCNRSNMMKDTCTCDLKILSAEYDEVSNIVIINFNRRVGLKTNANDANFESFFGQGYSMQENNNQIVIEIGHAPTFMTSDTSNPAWYTPDPYLFYYKDNIYCVNHSLIFMIQKINNYDADRITIDISDKTNFDEFCNQIYISAYFTEPFNSININVQLLSDYGDVLQLTDQNKGSVSVDLEKIEMSSTKHIILTVTITDLLNRIFYQIKEIDYNQYKVQNDLNFISSFSNDFSKILISNFFSQHPKIKNFDCGDVHLMINNSQKLMIKPLCYIDGSNIIVKLNYNSSKEPLDLKSNSDYEIIFSFPALEQAKVNQCIIKREKLRFKIQNEIVTLNKVNFKLNNLEPIFSTNELNKNVLSLEFIPTLLNFFYFPQEFTVALKYHNSIQTIDQLRQDISTFYSNPANIYSLEFLSLYSSSDTKSVEKSLLLSKNKLNITVDSQSLLSLTPDEDFQSDLVFRCFLTISISNNFYKDFFIQFLFYSVNPNYNTENIFNTLKLTAADGLTIVTDLRLFYQFCLKYVRDNFSIIGLNNFCLDSKCYYYIPNSINNPPLYCNYNDFEIALYNPSLLSYCNDQRSIEKCSIKINNIEINFDPEYHKILEIEKIKFHHNIKLFEFDLSSDDQVLGKIEEMNHELIKAGENMNIENAFLSPLAKDSFNLDFYETYLSDHSQIVISAPKGKILVENNEVINSINNIRAYLSLNNQICNNYLGVCYLIFNLVNLNDFTTARNKLDILNQIEINLECINCREQNKILKTTLMSKLIYKHNNETLITYVTVPTEFFVKEQITENIYYSFIFKVALKIESTQKSLAETSFLFDFRRSISELVEKNDNLYLSNPLTEKVKVNYQFDSNKQDYISLQGWSQIEEVKIQFPEIRGNHKIKLRSVGNLFLQERHYKTNLFNSTFNYFEDDFSSILYQILNFTNSPINNTANAKTNISNYYLYHCDLICGRNCLILNDRINCPDDDFKKNESFIVSVFDKIKTNFHDELENFLDLNYFLLKNIHLKNNKQVINYIIEGILDQEQILNKNLDLEVNLKLFRLFDIIFTDVQNLQVEDEDCSIYSKVYNLIKNIFTSSGGQLKGSSFKELYDSGIPIYFNFTNLELFHQKKFIQKTGDLFEDFNSQSLHKINLDFEITQSNREFPLQHLIPVEISLLISNFNYLCQEKHHFSNLLDLEVKFIKEEINTNKSIKILNLNISLPNEDNMQNLNNFLNKIGSNATLEEILECRLDEYIPDKSTSTSKNYKSQPEIKKNLTTNCNFDYKQEPIFISLKETAVIKKMAYLKKNDDILILNFDMFDNSTEILSQITYDNLKNNLCFVIFLIIAIFQFIIGITFLIFEKEETTNKRKLSKPAAPDSIREKMRIQASYLGKAIFTTINESEYLDLFSYNRIDKFEVLQQLKLKKLDPYGSNKEIKIMIMSAPWNDGSEEMKESIIRNKSRKDSTEKSQKLAIERSRSRGNSIVPLRGSIEAQVQPVIFAEEPQYEKSSNFLRMLIYMFPFYIQIINIFCFVDPYRHKFLKLFNLNTKYILSLFLTAVFFNKSKERDIEITLVSKVIISLISFLLSVLIGKMQNVLLQRNSKFQTDALSLDSKLNQFKSNLKRKNISSQFLTSDEFFDYFNNFNVKYEEIIKFKIKEQVIRQNDKRYIRVILGVIISLSLWSFICMYLILFGFYFGKQDVYEWFVSFLITVLLDFTLNPVLKILTVYLTLHYFRRRSFTEKNEILRKYFEIYTLYL